MSRPILFVCRGCEGDGQTHSEGETLYQRVKALRREWQLKEVIRLEGVKCLDECDTPCTIKLKGSKRSSYTRIRVNAVREAEAVLHAAAAYAALRPGEELAERKLPGVSVD